MPQEFSLRINLDSDEGADPQTVLSALIDGTARIAETGRYEGPIYNSKGEEIGDYELEI